MTIGSMAQVYHGTADETAGGLKRKDIKKTKEGRIVSKDQAKKGRANPWMKAVSQARKELGIEGFVLLNKGTDGTRLYARAKEIYEKKK